MANNMFCCRELVRTYIKNFENKILKELCSTIKFKLGENYYDIPNSNNSPFFSLNNFESFEFGDKQFTPNFEFTKLVYGCLFEEHYIGVDKLIEEAIVLNKSFDIKEQNLFYLKIL